jgi:signal transduction histidine kinase
MLSIMADEERATGHDIRSDMRAAAEVKGDALELSRLFQNLIDNAKKFAGSAEISLTVDGKKACITVADRGAGIPPTEISNMFMPFTRGEPSRNRKTGGVGLGLSIARTIARQHGGELVLSNRPGGGLLAEVILPLALDAN